MIYATVEHGLFGGECGACHGLFYFTVQEGQTRPPANGKFKVFANGRCPLCDAEVKGELGSIRPFVNGNARR
jgi:hypothetical protein